MEVALYAEAPVLLVGDIDRGGVFASLFGTVALLAPDERELVRGIVVNKFRGDLSLLEPGLRQLEEMTSVPVIGVVPYFRDIYVPEEDSPASQALKDPAGATVLDVAVIALPHIANFDDFDPLRREKGVGLRYVRGLQELGSPDLIILPGTKTTVDDLRSLRQGGLAARLVELAEEGTPVIGICGGFQMLGQRVVDHGGIESTQPSTPGLGLLPVVTEFADRKETRQVRGTVAADRGLLRGARGLPVEGYEIHMGTTRVERDGGGESSEVAFRLSSGSGDDAQRDDGYVSPGGWVLGSYMHGLFHNTELRQAILARVAARRGISLDLGADGFSQAGEYDKLADLVRDSLDMHALYDILGLPGG